MPGELSPLEERQVAYLLLDWRLLDEVAGNHFANSYVLRAVANDRLALSAVRAMVYDIISCTKLPQSPLWSEPKEYRAQVAFIALDRLESNNMRSWRLYAMQLNKPRHGKFRAFVGTVAYRAGVSLSIREQKRHSKMILQNRESELLYHWPMEQTQKLIQALAQLHRLKTRDREGLLMRALGYSWREIAEHLGFSSEDSASTQIRRVRQRLRAHLRSQGWDKFRGN